MKKTIRSSFSILLIGVITFLQNGCSNQSTMEPLITIAPSESLVPPKTSPTSTPLATATLLTSHTATPKIDSTQQAWRSTAIVVRGTESAMRKKLWNENETQVAQFFVDCSESGSFSGNISSDGQWVAVSCGYKGDQTLIVQNKKGTKWVLDFKDFLSPQTPKEIMGSLHPKFWSPDGNYLFFTTELGYDGGGNYCFPQDRGDYGLFHLNLKNGVWATLIPATDSFPGYEIEFSPTGRRYAITLDGAMITDLQTGKLTKIETNEVVERMVWSPDGTNLAYSVASCDEQSVISSATYIWDAMTNQTRVLAETNGIILRPESWMDNSTLRIIGEEISGLDSSYTIYQYGIQQGDLIFTGTATPNP